MLLSVFLTNGVRERGSHIGSFLDFVGRAGSKTLTTRRSHNYI